MTIRLTTLGGLRVFGGDAELEGLPAQPLRAALFVYLAVERRVSRASLLTVFWPERDEAHARQSLRQGLYHLRKLLRDDWLDAHAQELRIGRGVHTAVHAFPAALGRGARDCPPGPTPPAPRGATPTRRSCAAAAAPTRPSTRPPPRSNAATPKPRPASTPARSSTACTSPTWRRGSRGCTAGARSTRARSARRAARGSTRAARPATSPQRARPRSAGSSPTRSTTRRSTGSSRRSPPRANAPRRSASTRRTCGCSSRTACARSTRRSRWSSACAPALPR